MSSLLIEGPSRLSGEVSVRGAKNAALPVLLAGAVGRKTVRLSNVPVQMIDIQSAIAALRHVGCGIDFDRDEVRIEPDGIRQSHLPAEIAGAFRSSLLFLSIFLGRFGEARIYLPGGCNLGDRKFDLHLSGLEQLGAVVDTDDESITVSAKRLVGTDIQLYLPTTTGTENIMIAACFAEGRTRIFNANTRPEIVDLGNFLNLMGARVSVRNRVVEVEGPADFSGGSYRVMCGWDEALTYMIAAGMTGGEICIRDFDIRSIRGEISYLREAGIDVFDWGGNVYVSGKDKQLRPFDLFTAPYPGVNSDMQPLFAALAGCCHGESTITDQRFTERFQYVAELQKLGHQIMSYGNCAVVRGPNELIGAPVTAIDLRCGAALLISALASRGETRIDNAEQISRGYEEVANRFNRLGARVPRADG